MSPYLVWFLSPEKKQIMLLHTYHIKVHLETEENVKGQKSETDGSQGEGLGAP